MIAVSQGLSWGDKIGLLVTLITALGSAVAACLAAWRTGKTGQAVADNHAELREELRLPSNGTTLGAGIEAIGQKQDLAIGLAHPELESPSFVQLARSIQPTPPVERRKDTPDASQP